MSASNININCCLISVPMNIIDVSLCQCSMGLPGEKENDYY